MIKITQIRTGSGLFLATVEYDGPFIDTKTMTIDLADVRDRLKQVSKLLGRKPVLKDVKDAIIAIVNDARNQKEYLDIPINLSDYLNINLEAT
jgi:hypothetical protein